MDTLAKLCDRIKHISFELEEEIKTPGNVQRKLFLTNSMLSDYRRLKVRIDELCRDVEKSYKK